MTRIETYIPLYRKYRPQQFADVVGQGAIVQTLGNAITLNKVAHAYLFCGPRGTGKTSTARIFAKSLNCEQGPTLTPCLQCASCTGIAQGNALDVVEFDAASNNGVDDARELIENCQYTSMTGRFKVYIIDEVHMLTTQAFNALLKTLEEPPPNVIFIFATTEAHKVLPTIVSRCQRFDFNRITTENIVARLRHIAGKEAIRIDEDALWMIGRHARGGLRDAVGLLDQVAVLGRAQADKVIDRKDVALFIGTLEEDLLLKLGEAIAERRAADLLNHLTELAARGVEPIQLLKDLTMHFRNLLLVQAAGADADPNRLALPTEYFEALQAQVGRFPEPEEIPQIIGRLASVERNIRNSQQPQLWLEVGLLELAYRYEIHLVKELSERVARLEAQLAGSGEAPVSRPAMSQPRVTPESLPSAMPAAPEPFSGSTPTVTPGEPVHPRPAGGSLEADYARVVNMVPGVTRSLLQQQTFPISLQGDKLLIGCASEPIMTTLKSKSKFIHLQKAADQFYGRPMHIDLVLEKKRPESPPPPPGPLFQAESPRPAVAPPEVENVPAMPSAVAVAEPPPSVEVIEPDLDDPDLLPPVSAASPPPPVGEGSPELDEAKEFTLKLLQGRVLE